jgi:protease-4
MKGFGLISAVLRGRWLIDKAYAESHLPFVQNLITGGAPNFAGPADKNGIEARQNEDLQKFPMAGQISAGTFTARRFNSFDDAPDNSIAIINISGPIMKEGGECGEPGAKHFTSWIKMANVSPKISGILLNIDSPGGMVDGTQTLVNAIQSSKKPVVAFIDDGMMASAATWIGTAAKEVYASQKTDTIGSIGVFCTLYDFREAFAKAGIKRHEIYAPQSADKNKAYYEAIDNKPALMQEELKLIADEFIAGVKSARAGKLDLSKGDPFTGKMFSADQAIEIGLIDGYANIESAVDRVYQLAKATKTETTFFA